MPIEKTKVNPNRRELMRMCRDQIYDWCGHNEAWRNNLAHDMNTLLGHFEVVLEDETTHVVAEPIQAALRIVKRVAEFEGIRRASK